MRRLHQKNKSTSSQTLKIIPKWNAIHHGDKCMVPVMFYYSSYGVCVVHSYKYISCFFFPSLLGAVTSMATQALASRMNGRTPLPWIGIHRTPPLAKPAFSPRDTPNRSKCDVSLLSLFDLHHLSIYVAQSWAHFAQSRKIMLEPMHMRR